MLKLFATDINSSLFLSEQQVPMNNFVGFIPISSKV